MNFKDLLPLVADELLTTVENIEFRVKRAYMPASSDFANLTPKANGLLFLLQLNVSTVSLGQNPLDFNSSACELVVSYKTQPVIQSSSPDFWGKDFSSNAPFTLINSSPVALHFENTGLFDKITCRNAALELYYIDFYKKS